MRYTVLKLSIMIFLEGSIALKLDNDLVRIMLLQVETDTDGHTNYEIESYCEARFPEYETNTTTYHMKYLIDAEFVQAKNGAFRDITPAGRDFLNNVRNEGVWEDTKKAIKPLGSVALNIVSEIAASIIKKTLNLS